MFVFSLPLSSLQSACTKLSSVASLAVPYFSISSHKWQKCLSSFSLQPLSETLLILRIIQRDIMNVHTPACKVQVFLSDFSQTPIFKLIFEQSSSIKIHENLFSWSPAVPYRQTDNDKANSRFFAILRMCLKKIFCLCIP